MKKLLMIILLALLSFPVLAQDDLFIIFELMHVDNEQEGDYAQTEQFWKKIHAQRAADGSIVGWDLWSLLPGGEDQGYQYATATLFDSAEKMFAPVDYMKYAKAAYPDMSDEDLNKRLWSAGKTRDLAVRTYLHELASTTGGEEMKVGTVAYMDYMKAPMDGFDAYETAEKTLFQPMHQKMVDNGSKSYWGLLRIMIPFGSDTYASHMTVNMFKNVKQALSANAFDPDLSEDQIKKINEAMQTRDMKFVYMATLIEMVR
ncbi:hypothetical protein V8G61_11935 [Gaetbulibacter sp. M240]|uniref:hypothetical protein n=1 Tax=Gaetbulibacter sp. M240 TaxID=3126511 RepID=UPI00374F25F6